MPEAFSPSLNPSSDYDVFMSSIMADPKRDNTLTLAPDLFALDPHPPDLSYTAFSDASISSSPSSYSLFPPDREESAPLDAHPVPDLTQLFMGASSPQAPTMSPTVSPAMTQALSPQEGDNPIFTLLHSVAATPSISPAAVAPKPESVEAPPATGSNGLSYKSVCKSLKEMAASDTPASAMMQFLNLSRHALNQEIPAEIVLQGLIERERRRQAASSPMSSPAAPGFGAQRRPRQSLREAASPYAIPAGPRMYQCDQCPLVFDRAYNLKEHLKTHDPNCNKRFPCPLTGCPHASHRRADMHRHIKNVHMKNDGLSETEKNMVLAAYPAMQADICSDAAGSPSGQ